jgi:hypothetical protein
MDSQNTPTQNVSNLTLSELEKVIEEIVNRKMREEMNRSPVQSDSSLLETFGTWQDDKTDEMIIEEIYTNRSRQEI